MFPWLKIRKGKKEISPDVSYNHRNKSSYTYNGKSSSRPRKLERAKKLSDKLRHPREDDGLDTSRGSHPSDLSSEVGFSSAQGSGSPSSSNLISPCLSNISESVCQPLPLPSTAKVSGNGYAAYALPQHSSQTLPSVRGRLRECVDVDGVISGSTTDSISSDISLESVEAKDSGSGQGQTCSPYCRSSEGEIRKQLHTHGSVDLQASSNSFPSQRGSRCEVLRPVSPRPTAPGSQRLALKNGQGEAAGEVHIHIHVNGVHGSASNSSFTSPIPSPRAMASSEPPGQNSGHNSCRNLTKGDLQLTLQQRKISPEMSPLQSPKKSPNVSSRGQSRALSPLHSKASGSGYGSLTGWSEEQRQAHPLPLPPNSAGPGLAVPQVSGSASPRPRLPRSPGRTEPTPSSGKWIKGQLLGSGSFGKVYRGIHSETGDMCAIKEVELISDDSKSKESAKQLQQEIALLSTLRHPNIVHYKGSEMIGDNLYIYLEIVSGGSIYRLLQEFKHLEEPIIQRYTRQILQGLQYLHSKSTVHRDIKGANILVDHDGRIKLADFGMAKIINADASPLSFKGSPYWMAPEVFMQRNTGYEFAVDIWSLGCTIIEMATGKPPWSEYEWGAAMFKVARSDSPPIPDSLSPEGKEFLKLCLQKNPAHRPTAATLLEHAFVQIANDGPDPAAQDVNDIGVGMRERRMSQEIESAFMGTQRSTTRHLLAGESHHAEVPHTHPSIYPSRSAPVSPRSSRQAYDGFATRPLTLQSGYSTPPNVGKEGLLDYRYEGYRLPVNQAERYLENARQLPNTRHGNSVALQAMVHGEPERDFKWSPLLARSPMWQEHDHREKTILQSSYLRVPRNTEQDPPMGPYHDPYRRLDEQVTQQLLKRPPPAHTWLNEQESPVGSKMVSHTNP